MSIYESAKKYADKLKMTIEQATIRLDYFNKIKEEQKETRKCPKCQQYTLEVEGGEWELSIPDWIYCTNDKIKKIEDGEEYYDDCDFTDDVKDKYLFAFEADFDLVLMVYCSIDINDENAVKDFTGLTWEEFVEKDTREILSEEELNTK